MNGKVLRVCIISHQSRLEGAERSLLELIAALQKKDVWMGVIVAKPEGPFMRELDKMGVPWKSVPFAWWTRRTSAPDFPAGPVLNRMSKASEKIARIAGDWNADILYSNTSVIGAGALAAVLTGKPHIWHIREAASQPLNYEFLIPHSDLEGIVSATSNRVIFNSKAVQAEWTRDQLPVSKSKVIYNYVTLPERVDSVQTDRRADVVIPMHDDRFILQCLDSILRHRSSSLHRVYILDDRSRDESLIAEVKELAGKNGDLLEYRRSDKHNGFVGTCNLGMQISSERDVVLLNSDTLVTYGWIEKLKKTAHHKKEIGTVTPMSNNASLVSLPGLYENNRDEDPDRTGRWLEEVAPVDYTDIPTSHGFCVYIKREAIEEVGVFDRETFGMGYGEENDFSMRLLKSGYRNVASCRTYVYHKGAQSFGEEERNKMIEKNYKIILERYPEYSRLLKSFRQSDPFKDLRKILRALRKDPSLEKSFKIAIIGTVTRWKNQMEAVRALAELRDRGKDVVLLIGGDEKDSSYADEIRAFAEEHGVRDRVIFLGYLDHANGILSFADVTVVCSSFEPFGRVTLESMLAGTPVVGANGGGTAELISEGGNGILYTPGNHLELSKKIESLIDEPERLDQLGKVARSWANEFNLKTEYGNSVYRLLQEEKGNRNPSSGLGKILAPLIDELSPLASSEKLAGKIFRKLSTLWN
ncbi:MAG: glycosyltransferase [Balneolaceae bacterium]